MTEKTEESAEEILEEYRRYERIKKRKPPITDQPRKIKSAVELLRK